MDLYSYISEAIDICCLGVLNVWRRLGLAISIASQVLSPAILIIVLVQIKRLDKLLERVLEQKNS